MARKRREGKQPWEEEMEEAPEEAAEEVAPAAPAPTRPVYGHRVKGAYTRTPRNTLAPAPKPEPKPPVTVVNFGEPAVVPAFDIVEDDDGDGY